MTKPETGIRKSRTVPHRPAEHDVDTDGTTFVMPGPGTLAGTLL